ncbi:MAG: T9SS type A sorting domain-containing protein [Flavobacteriales bacterium]|nr:T9SS type A sorting domain-containing protein [Flavobacteriales bacterium]HQX31010.1 T9SS type A sorting domain-containing protein [Flavobacteriales bacterium]
MLRNIIFLVSMVIAMALHAQSPSVRGYEYWFDQNHTNRIFVAVAPATTVNLINVPLDTDTLSVGTHIVHLRLKDHTSDGAVRWSSVVTRTFEKLHTGPWEIVAVRYWVGTPTNELDPLVRTKVFDSPQQQINYANSPLDLCGYPTGNQTLKLQLKDNHGQWSSVVSRTVNVETAGTLGQPVITATPVPNNFCPGAVVTFTATPPSGPNIALPGAYNWTVPTGAGWSYVTSTGNTITVTIGSSAGTVQVFSTNACGTSATASFPVNISQEPAQPSPVQGIAACAGSLTTFSVDSVSGVDFEWSVPGGSPSTGSGSTFSTTLTANATITVTPVNSCGVYGPERSAAITVSQPSNAGTNGNVSTCSGMVPQSLFAQLGGNPSAGGTWSGPSPIANGEYNPATMNPGVYSYLVAGVGACSNATATVTVVENQEPNAGANGTLSACSNGDPVSLFAQLTGNPQVGGNWSGPSPTTGSYDPSAMDPGVYTYMVNGISPCGNASATVTVSETDAPNAGSSSALTLCQTSDPADLFVVLGGNPQAGGNWSGPSATSGMFDPTNMQSGTYTYLVSSSGPCPSASATVSVVVNSLPNAGSDGNLELCDNAAAVSLFESLGGVPQSGGSWTPNAPNDMYDPATMNPGVYTYTVLGTAPCPTASATVTVSETNAPNAGENASLVLCAEADPVDLLTVLNGTPDPDGAWTGPSELGSSFFDPAIALEGDYSYTIVGTGTCLNNTATVNVNVMDLDLVMIDGTATVDELGTLLFTTSPELPDADSIVWTIPTGWNWAGTDNDPLDEMAYLDPPDAAGFYTICARAYGGGCAGDTAVCFETQLTVGAPQLDRESSSVSIYPNPNNGQFTITMEGFPTTCHIKILDALGKEVLQQYMIGGSSTMQMDLGDLASGVYYVRIETEREVMSLPVVVQR